MITLKDINKAIDIQVIKGLKDSQYSAVEFTSTDIKEKIIRPSFYLEFESNKTGKFNSVNKERTLSTKIYYFPSSKTKFKIELMEMQELLEDIFLEGLQVTDDFFIHIDEIDFDITTGVLLGSFELYTIEGIIDATDYELMEELELEINNK